MKHWTSYLPNSPTKVVNLADAVEKQRENIKALQERVGKAQLTLDVLEVRFVDALSESGYTEQQKQDARDELQAIALLQRLEFSAAKVCRTTDPAADRGLSFAHGRRWIELQQDLVSNRNELFITSIGRERLAREHGA